MPKIIEGHLNATGRRFAIVVGRFNNFLSDRLVEGAVDTLLRHGAADDDIHVYKVPGSFEIPMMAKKTAMSGNYDAVICIGALIRGATPHFEYIASEVTKGIANISLELGIPLTYGIITADTLEQAIERSGTKAGNKGADAANSAIEMVDLYRRAQ
ncbi:MAG: 6,7-dimethyl-8-ribityllumazine synthase [Deltaproteobacteria bacterium CG_4_9_14_3_um_filter_63_12]|nr:MAG: 6,7-dimethyl-8-ribityllumazine synthase [Deltaproteobacteria bacterium CG_4_9_14_3_um_filter_63_12]